MTVDDLINACNETELFARLIGRIRFESQMVNINDVDRFESDAYYLKCVFKNGNRCCVVDYAFITATHERDLFTECMNHLLHVYSTVMI